MWESWLWPLGREDPPEEGMATHSSISAWRVPWTEQPAGHCPWGCRVGHDRATKQEHNERNQREKAEKRVSCSASWRERSWMAAGAGSRHGVRWAVSAHSLLCSCAVSRILFLATPPTIARQAPLSVGFSRQEYCRFLRQVHSLQRQCYHFDNSRRQHCWIHVWDP